MADKSGNSKKQRKTKKSAGIHGGGGKTKLTELQKILMGKGLVVSFAAIGSNGRAAKGVHQKRRGMKPRQRREQEGS